MCSYAVTGTILGGTTVTKPEAPPAWVLLGKMHESPHWVTLKQPVSLPQAARGGFMLCNMITQIFCLHNEVLIHL